MREREREREREERERERERERGVGGWFFLCSFFKLTPCQLRKDRKLSNRF